MSKSSHLSGFQKRKKRRMMEMKCNDLPKITMFLKSDAPALVLATETTPMDIEFQIQNNAKGDATDEIDEKCIKDHEVTMIKVNESNSQPDPVSYAEPVSDIIISTISQRECDDAIGTGSTFDDRVCEFETIDFQNSNFLTYSFKTLKNFNYKSDKANFTSIILTAEQKRFILEQGPCRPLGPFPRDMQGPNKGRGFTDRYYTHMSKAGIKLHRLWLCYSPILNRAYCEPCWLFGDCKKKTKIGSDSWINGFTDWQHLSRSIERHEYSNYHLGSCRVYEQWRLKGTLDETLQAQLRQEVNYWRQVLDRLINVTLTLAMSNLPFRGHRETRGESNSGNFLSIIELLSKYDPIITELFKKPKGAVTYLSPTIQNEIIEILAHRVQENIIKEIKKAPFYSVIVDTTQDVAKIDQLSHVFRYVLLDTNEHGKIKEIQIKESFLGFLEVDGQSSEELVQQIINCIEEKSLDLAKLRGQGYDGASNMAGVYSGVQARISKKVPLAKYVHCAAHTLNLVLNDSVKPVPDISYFYVMLEKLYVFFAHSIKRWAMLSSLSKSNVALKKLCSTRWSSRNESLLALRFRFTDILKCLSKIVLLSNKPEERNEATLLLKYFQQFKVVLLIVFQTKILTSIDAVSQMLQSQTQDLSKAAQDLENAYKTMVCLRDQFQEIKQDAVKIAKNWGIEARFEDKRVPKVKRNFDELSSDQRLCDPESKFKVTVFYQALDIIISQLKNRFKGLNDIVSIFLAIQPVFLASAKDDEIYSAGAELAQTYNSDLSSSFPQQLLSLRSCLLKKIKLITTVMELAKLLIIDNNIMSSTFPDVCTACLLFLTIPVTVSSAERSFSNLKLIKTYLRNTISESRLSSLAILSIENSQARSLNIQELVKIFAEQKARRCKF